MNRPSLFFWCNGVILCASLLTGLRVLPGPDALGILLAFHALIVLPGLVAWRLAGAGIEADADGVCRVLLTGLALACVVVCLGFIPGATYPVIAHAYGGLLLAGLLIDGLRSGGGSGAAVDFKARADGDAGGKRLQLLVIVLLFVLCCVFMYGSGETAVDTDAPDHISFIRRSLDGGALLPHDSFHREGDGTVLDPRKGLWHPVVALWAWQADAAPEVLWQALPGVLAFLALAVFWLFAAELVGPVPLRLVALVLLFLFFRGEGLGWLTRLGYSRNVAQIAAWGTIAFLIRYLRSSRRLYLASAVVLAPAGAAIHLDYAAVVGMSLLSLLVFVVAARAGRSWRAPFAVAASLVVAALAFPAALRLMHAPSETNLIHEHVQGMLELGNGLRLIDPAELIARFDLAFLFALALAPFFFLLALGGERTALTGTLFIVPVVLVLNPLTATILERQAGYFHVRLLHAAPVICFLALSVAGLLRAMIGGSAVRRRGGGTSAGRWLVRAFAAAALLYFALVFLRPAVPRLAADVARLALRDPVEASDGLRIGRFLEDLPRHSVIASDPATSYLVSAFSDHFVVVILDQHCSPADTGALKRVRSTRDLFDPALPLEASTAWLRSAGVGYVLVDSLAFGTAEFFGVTAFLEHGDVLEKFRSRPSLLREIRSAEGLHLFAFDADLAQESRREDVDRAAGVFGACEPRRGEKIDLPGENKLILADFDAGSALFAAGDSVAFDICWSAVEPLQYGLPLYWTLRFDTHFPRGAFHRQWYGKQYRRHIERRNMVLYRFTVSGRVAGGHLHPDVWPAGAYVRQTVGVVLPRGLAAGEYVVRLTVSRRAYLPNRTPADYLRNEDSLHGVPVGSISIVRPGQTRPGA